MFTLDQPPGLIESCACSVAKRDPIPVTEGQWRLGHLLQYVYPVVRKSVISELALLGHVLEAAIKYDVPDEAVFLLCQRPSEENDPHTNSSSLGRIHGFCFRHTKAYESVFKTQEQVKIVNSPFDDSELGDKG